MFDLVDYVDPVFRATRVLRLLDNLSQNWYDNRKTTVLLKQNIVMDITVVDAM